MNVRRIYRAVAVYADGSTVTRHYQTKRARDRWATQRLEGYPAVDGDLRDPYDDGAAPIPPAVRVDVADSNPVTWP